MRFGPTPDGYGEVVTSPYHEEGRRTVVWFSAGAASAVAAKLTLSAPPVAGTETVIAYTDPGSEHPDNARFLDDAGEWFGQEVLRLRSPRYRDTWQVWDERRFLVGPAGALCTAELKKKVRYAFERPDDIQVFGYTAEEQSRADRFREQNPGVDLRCPLIERGLTKDDCIALVASAGIEIPAMYKLGYRNNNCVGCPKGGMGYWNKIRKDFPEVFDRMAQVERNLGITINAEEERIKQPDGKVRRVKIPIYLDELDPTRGNHLAEPSFECSLLCQTVTEELSGDETAAQ